MPPIRHWTKDLVYVLVPDEGVTEKEVLSAARLACRVAMLRELFPVCPVLYYSGFATPEDASLRIPKVSMRWFYRSSKVWLQFPDSENRLDRLSFRILEENERSCYPNRRTVYTLERFEDEVIPVPLSRDEIRDILDANILHGLAAGCM